MTLAATSHLAVGLLLVACSCSGTLTASVFGRRQGVAFTLVDEAQEPRVPAGIDRSHPKMAGHGEFFSQTLIIKLAKRRDRLAHALQTIADAGLSHGTRWNASVPTEAEIDSAIQHMRHPEKARSRPRVRGMLGLLQSWTHLLRHLHRVGRPGEMYLVLEDDVEISRDFIPALRRLNRLDWFAARNWR